MGFQQTLRMVQMTRAVTILFSCVSVSMFAYVMDIRFSARKKFVQGLNDALPEFFENQTPSRSALGTLAMFGLAIALIWDGLCLFDLCVKKHYRYDRRVCIFVDITVALVLLVTGFINFSFDAILAALDVTSKQQMRVEIPAIIFLTFVCMMHIAFFCYGCKDPAASALEFEHVPLEPASPMLPHHDYDSRSMRSRGNTLENRADLVEIDLGKKVQIIKVQPKANDVERTPPRTPREESEHKRLGFVGTPAQINNAAPHRTPNPEESPFLDQHHGQEWI